MEESKGINEILDDDHDYTFDRLAQYTYLDPEQLSITNPGPHKVYGSAGDVTYSLISHVTFWEGKCTWSHEDLRMANEVYAKVNAQSKQLKRETVDKELGT